MPLGCDKLTDDQLVELLQEACSELACRSDLVRNHAQRVIKGGAWEMEQKLKALEQEVTAARRSYVDQIKQETKEDVRRMLTTGEIRVVKPAEECDMAVQAHKDALVEILAEIEAGQRTGQNFHMWIRGPLISATFGSKTIDVRHSLTKAQIALMGDYLTEVIRCQAPRPPLPGPIRKKRVPRNKPTI